MPTLLNKFQVIEQIRQHLGYALEKMEVPLSPGDDPLKDFFTQSQPTQEEKMTEIYSIHHSTYTIKIPTKYVSWFMDAMAQLKPDDLNQLAMMADKGHDENGLCQVVIYAGKKK